MTRLLTLLIISVLCLFSCQEKTKQRSGDTERAFYYWQTSTGNFQWRDSLFIKMRPEKLYMRFFDVDWNKDTSAPKPVGILHLNYYDTEFLKTQIVPVVFITNETFKNLPAEDVPALARNVYRRLSQMQVSLLVSATPENLYLNDDWYEQHPYQMKSKNFDEQRKYDSAFTAQMNVIKEIQFDCDWTKSTRDKYFAFLHEVTKLFNDKLVTSTIRLYQYKYPNEAGVPPVKRGVLMCYNAGDIKDKATRNSIFDREEVMSYLKGGDYPVPLDYALPVFQWALLFHDDKLTSILPDHVLDHPSVEKTGDAKYRVTSDFVLGDLSHESIYLRKGDEIKVEKPSLEDVKKVAEWLSEHKNNPDALLALYHLSNVYLQRYHHEMEDIFYAF